MSNARKTPEFLNGVPELLLLRLLDRRPMYGYELVQTIRVATGAALEFGEGSIYPVLHRLEAEKALAAKRETVGGRSRVVYRITLRGQARLAESAALWRRVVAAVQVVLQGESHERPTVA